MDSRAHNSPSRAAPGRPRGGEAHLPGATMSPTALGHTRAELGRGLAIALLAGVALYPAGAQSTPSSAQRGNWLPREVQWPRSGTPAERATAMATLERFEQMLRGVPGLARPNGFEILPQFAGGHRPLGQGATPIPNGVMRYSLGLTMFSPSRAQAEGRACIQFVVNDDAPPAAHRDGTGREFYVEGDRGPTIAGATQVLGGLDAAQGARSGVAVLFTANGALPWRQPTREEFVNALIFEAEGKDGATSDELKAKLAKTPYEEWVEGAAQRKRERDETIAQARSLQGAAQAQKLKEQLESMERDVTERLKKEDGAVQERFAAARGMVDKAGADLRATLAAMTPAERRMPAVVNNALTEGPLVGGYRLTSSDAPPAWRVLTPQYEFWRARRSPVEVRSIRVSIGLSGTCLKPEIQVALRDAFARMDWAAIRAMADAPR